MPAHFQPVDLKKAYRLLNHGPTVLVSASHDGVDNVMAAAWACALDFDPPKVTVVLTRSPKPGNWWKAAAGWCCMCPMPASCA